MSAININKNNFENEVLNSDKTVLFRFLGILVCALPYGSTYCRGDCEMSVGILKLERLM